MAKHKAEETVRVRVGSVLMVGGREGRKEGGGGDDGNIPPTPLPPSLGSHLSVKAALAVYVLAAFRWRFSASWHHV